MIPPQYDSMMNAFNEFHTAQNCVYIPGGLLGEILISLQCFYQLGMKSSFQNEPKGVNPYSTQDIQSFLTTLLTEYNFPVNAILYPLRQNPEVAVPDEDNPELRIETIPEVDWVDFCSQPGNV